MNWKLLTLVLGSVLFCFAACKKETVKQEDTGGHITLRFEHYNDGTPQVFDVMDYVNAAGNQYMVSNIQYFISNVTLYPETGDSIVIDEMKRIHYIDTDIASTLQWEVYDALPAGKYDSIAFTLGLNETENVSFAFVNPPESNMFWPEYLGGGYHYLKLNGKWLETDQSTQNRPFEFHLGRLKVYDGQHVLQETYPNYFRVVLPESVFVIDNEQRRVLRIIMNTEEWFQNPHVYDHNEWGAYIMNNPEAMNIAKENGYNVFTLKFVE